ncbi:MAG: Na+/H+ antiporter NhaC family protein [Wenzhouxiangellaceae bacterium]
MRIILSLALIWVGAADSAWAAAELTHHGFLSVMPPLLAIVLALITRQVIPALFVGIWFGAWATHGMSLEGLWLGLLDSTQVYVLQALADADHAAIIIFSMMVGGMVGVISANGGMSGVVQAISRWVSDARSACIATAAMGLTIFFDDYANTLVVGNTMRPLTDANRVSREKLAYLVDSTAAPVACIALVTTWIGYEVGLVHDAIATIPDYHEAAYLVFLNSLAYSFYPILALIFVFMISVSGRDFGPMLAAERRARAGQPVSRAARRAAARDTADSHDPEDTVHSNAVYALVPVLVLVVTVIAALWVTGSAKVADENAGLRDIIGAADSYKALMWGSLLGVLSAFALTLGGRLLSLEDTIAAWFDGLKSMLLAMIILLLAWSLSATTETLGTANYLISVLPDALVPAVLPSLVFVLAAATAFATGSSWGTMGILLPLVVPLAWALLGRHDMTGAEHWHILYSAVAAVLTGAVWGDHCSPISDTTILSSMASECDHIEHVRTQLPYALLVGASTIALGTLPAGFGLPWWLCLLAAALSLALILWWLGRTPEESAASPKPAYRE